MLRGIFFAHQGLNTKKEKQMILNRILAFKQWWNIYPRFF